MKATSLLKEQHQVVKKLFDQIENASDRAEKRRILQELAANLAAHMVIEQEIFYPACADALKDQTLVLEAYEEHAVARYELRRLLAVKGRDDTFDSKAKVLKELITHHVKEEESEFFPKAENALGDERDSELGDEMKPRFDLQVTKPYGRVLREDADGTSPSNAGVSAIRNRDSGGKRAAARGKAKTSRAKKTAGTKRR